MKQLILRISDDLHRRIAARAAREGRSMNSWVNVLLDATVDADVAGDRQARLHAKAAELGMLISLDTEPIHEQAYRDAIESTRGLGPVLDDILADERGP
jgi:plasmid stability protein